MIGPVERAHVIEVARSWIGTPFHDQAAIKGVGVDCAHLLAAVGVEAGLVEPFHIEVYSPQFMLHRDDPLFESYVLRFTREIPEAEARMGDVVLYRVGRSFAHGGFIVEWPAAIIHAYKTYGGVVETGGREADLSERAVKFFSIAG